MPYFKRITIMLYFLPRVSFALIIFVASFICLEAFCAPRITEIMSDNEDSLLDEDGDFPDWIEIYNPDQVTIDLSGWYL